MPNFVDAMGYALGKLHVGLIAYMCDLYREGTVRPLELLLNRFNVPVPQNPIPVREWRIGPRLRVDLAIFDGDADIPSIIIEMKVDDHESFYKDVPQTTLYANASPHVNHRFFITLGGGEFYHPPYDRRFSWVRLENFARAIDEICAESIDNCAKCILCDWKDALQSELARRVAVLNNDRQHLATYRAGQWNITFLGNLKENLEIAINKAALNIDIDSTCYTYGTRPDTILNFGWSRTPLYAEINNNGRMNVKIILEQCNDDQACRQAVYAQYADVLVNQLNLNHGELRPYNARAATMTIASLDIGLESVDDALQYTNDQDHTVKALIRYLRVLY